LFNIADNEQEWSDREGMLFYGVNDENPTVGSMIVKPLVVNMLVNGVSVDMEIDSNAPVRRRPQIQFENDPGSLKFKQSDVRLSTFTGTSLNVIGFVHVNVKYGENSYHLKLYVVMQGRAILLGRDWL
jgi:hypothetical protein